MTESNVQPMIELDAQQMLCHLEHLFGGDLDGCHEGKIELAWTDGRDGKLKHAAIFGTDGLDELVEQAVKENRVPGQNVYVGQALRKPDIPPFGRRKDQDFLALTAFYVDLDDDVVATARINYRHRGCPPTAVVVTGRHPHVRAQMVWRQETPERDPDVCRRQNRALAQALDGDASVINPGRLMRLGGSIAWPVKPGRIIERTEFLTFDDGRPKVYYLGQLAKAFPPADADRPAQPTESSGKRDLNIGSEFDGVTVEACLAAIHAGDHWHDHLVRLTGHWIARRWSDEEILTAASALTLPGYTADQTRQEVARMIEGGRAKWNRPNPSHEVGPAEQAPFVLRPIGLLDPARRPPRDWLVRNRMMRKHTTLTTSAPGVGKSTLAIEEAVSLASGKDFLGFGITRPYRVAVINNEETRDELERRIEATCVHYEVPFTSIAETLFLYSGVDDAKLVVARKGPNDEVLVQPHARALTELARDLAIDVLVIDPFVQTHTVVENSNEQIEQVLLILRGIAVQANAALHLIHHNRKPLAGTSRQAGDIYAVRGGGAIAGDAHFVFTLADMGKVEAEELAIGQDDRAAYVRLDDAKGKMAPPSGARWFERVGVQMPYGLIGEEVGVLVPVTFDQSDAAVTTSTAVEILRQIQQRWDAGNPFSGAPQSDRYVVPFMVGNHGLAKPVARKLVRDWIANGMVKSETYDSDSKARGLRVIAWPR